MAVLLCLSRLLSRRFVAIGSVRFVVDSRQPANNKAGCMGDILQHSRVVLMLHVFYRFCSFLPFLTVFKSYLVDVFACMTVCVCTELYVLLPLWHIIIIIIIIIIMYFQFCG